MKDKKKLLLWIGIPATIFVLMIVLIVLFVFSYQKDKENTKKQMSEIKEEYEAFKEQVLVFSDQREDIYKEVFDGAYYVTIAEKKGEWFTKFEEYEKTVEAIDQKASKLKKACNGTLYPEKEVNSKCEAFQILYEQTINYFVKDVKQYQNNIDKYNEWIKEHSEYEEAKAFSSEKYKDYIDFNKDGVYFGKEIEGVDENEPKE